MTAQAIRAGVNRFDVHMSRLKDSCITAAKLSGHGKPLVRATQEALEKIEDDATEELEQAIARVLPDAQYRTMLHSSCGELLSLVRQWDPVIRASIEDADQESNPNGWFRIGRLTG